MRDRGGPNLAGSKLHECDGCLVNDAVNHDVELIEAWMRVEQRLDGAVHIIDADLKHLHRLTLGAVSDHD